VLYLREINSSQLLAWRRSIEVIDETTGNTRTLALFPEEREISPPSTPKTPDNRSLM